MPRIALSLLTALSLASVLAGPASAQGAGDARLRGTLRALGDSAHVQLLAPGLMVEDGYFLGVRGDSVDLAAADARITVGIDEIEALSVEGSRWRSLGAQTGVATLVAGATAGFFLGYWHCGSDKDQCYPHAARVSLRWGLVFGLGGAGVGALVGSRLRRWRAVFP